MRKEIALCLLITLITWSANAALPPAKEILDAVRMRQTLQEVDLQGQLRHDATVIPFHLTQTGPVIRYSFTNPAEALQLRLGEDNSRLEEITERGTEKIAPAQFDHKVRDTAVTYEDISFKFLYWPKAEVIGEETINTRWCWKLRMTAPSRESQYSSVIIWVDKKGGALMRMEGFNWNGRLAKRFEVISGQKIDGRWFLKQMRIEEMEPGTNKVQSRTYLEIKKPSGSDANG